MSVVRCPLPRGKFLIDDWLFCLLSCPLHGMVSDCFLAKAYLASRDKLNLKKKNKKIGRREKRHQGMCHTTGLPSACTKCQHGVLFWRLLAGRWKWRRGLRIYQRGWEGIVWGHGRRHNAGQQLPCCLWRVAPQRSPSLGDGGGPLLGRIYFTHTISFSFSCLFHLSFPVKSS